MYGRRSVKPERRKRILFSLLLLMGQTKTQEISGKRNG
jgi:hypothetical protein